MRTEGDTQALRDPMENTDADDRRFPPGEGPPEDAPRLRLAPEVAERFDQLEEKIDRLHTERDPDALLKEKEAADLLGVTPRTMQTMRAAGEINALRVRSCVRYTRAAVRDYIRRSAEGGCR